MKGSDQNLTLFLTILGSIVAAMVILSLAPLAGQTPAAGTALRTPWGAPDLQGIWSNQVATPFERPKEYGAREFLTEQEREALEKHNREFEVRTQAAVQDKRGTEADVAGAYNHNVFSDGPLTKVGKRTSHVIDPPDGRLPPLTPVAANRIKAKIDYLNDLLQGTYGGRPGPPSPRRAEPSPDYNFVRMNRADGPEDRSAGERCLQTQLPEFFGDRPDSPSTGTVIRIVESPDLVAIFYEVFQGGGFSRTIPITSAPHLPPNIRQRLGDARGHWEGDTLVIDVTNFTRKTDFRGSRENLHLIERYRRTDANTLSYQVTVEDPTTWTKPWTAIVDLTKGDERANQIYEPNCHEGNYGMVGILSDMRASEKAFAEGRGPDPATQDTASGGEGLGLPAGVGVVRAQREKEGVIGVIKKR